MSKSSTQQPTPLWKVVLAGFSVLLTVLVWTQGLEGSFDRPSVAPKLSLQQREMALLAQTEIPEPFKPVLLGLEPELAFQQALKEIPLEEMNKREKILLASLEDSVSRRKDILKTPFEEKDFLQVRNLLLNSSGPQEDVLLENLKGSENFEKDPLLFQTVCLAIGGDIDICVDTNVAKSSAIRLATSQILPFAATLLGICLLIRYLWMFVKNKTAAWTPVLSLPLTLTDMVLLVSGGFVVLGEVISPILVVPISSALTKSLTSPLSDSLKVLIGYISMTIPTLFILRQQLHGIRHLDRPSNGWLQWRFFPIGQAFLSAVRGWLMVLPLVLFIAWLMNLLVGDQGGSNPLLELVLGSRDPLALILLVLTTVVLAPLFEELVFRGVLLPVVAKELGSAWGVIVSAIVFALAHLSVGELPPLLVLGIGLGFLRLSSGRLFPCVLMHSLWNGVTFTSLILIG